LSIRAAEIATMSSYGMWLSAAGMKVNEHRQNVLANNMGNANTTGFKQDIAVVRERRVESQAGPGGFRFAHPVLDGLSGGVNVRPSHHDLGQGPVERTNRPLDAAIVGEGFFAVDDGVATRYTRNGSFAINSVGELVSTAGDGRWRVLDESGGVVTVDPSAGAVEITDGGAIRQGGETIARIALSAPDRPDALRKVGETMFEADAAATMRPANGQVTAGSLENSNFDVMRGLASMIEVTRAYQLNATMIQLQDEVTSRAVSTVGRLA
jgi:flagellar basal-body rod protein FlgG